MTDKQPSCEERIDAELEKELGQIQEALGAKMFSLVCLECSHEWESDDRCECCPECDSDDVYAERSDEEEKYGLSCPPYVEHVVVKLERSGGGPQDFWRLYLDPVNGEICKVSYHYLDWWDGAVRWLDDGQLALVAELFREQVRCLVEKRC